MIIRIWRARCARGKARDLRNFLETFALPTLEKQKGCNYANYGRRLERGRQEFLVLTVWNDLKSLIRFTGKKWKEPVVHPREAQCIVGKPDVEHYRTLGGEVRKIG